MSLDYDSSGPMPGMNLMEKEWLGSAPALGARGRWFNEARFGIFVHYGLYSVLGHGEWAMYRERIPPSEYNRLVDRFRAEHFDADQLARQIVKTGARYAVLTTRHHDGFCLWDSRTTDFTSTKTVVGRDLVAEYVDACRRHGLRVGIYHSLMNWQREAIFLGRERDPSGWGEMVDETHSQVRELMSDYGKIDVLWYDGCMAPGLEVDRAACWRSRELNAMVRQLQPDILINDRSALPEDFSTPEQELRPPPRGRAWECCMTMGEFWGWHKQDTKLKSSRELLEQMIFCARHGGNFLLNIAPCGDGRLSVPQQQRLDDIGDWMARKGESLRGTVRSSFTEEAHLGGVVTAKGKKVYLHLADPAVETVRMAGLTSPVLAVRMLGEDAMPPFRQRRGIVSWEVVSRGRGEMRVAEVELERSVPRKAPPETLSWRQGGRREVDDALINILEKTESASRQELTLKVEGCGRYRLELEVEADEAGVLSVLLGNATLRGSFKMTSGGYPEVIRMRSRVFREGEVALSLNEMAGRDFRVLRWRLVPEWQMVEAGRWMVSNSIATDVDRRGLGGASLKAVFDQSGAPDRGHEDSLEWRLCDQVGGEMSFSRMYPQAPKGIWFARTVISSPDDRQVAVLLACDWWANLFVNGVRVQSERRREDVAYDGAEFNGWKPQPAIVQLRKGPNEILVKCHPGDIDSWIEFRINDAGDLKYVRQH